MDKIHIRIRALREQFHFSQGYVGNWLGISQQAYSNYEKNKGEIPAKHAVELAKLYHVSTDYILGIEQEPICMDEEFIKDVTFRKLAERLLNLSEEGKMEMVDYLFLRQKKEPHDID